MGAFLSLACLEEEKKDPSAKRFRKLRQCQRSVRASETAQSTGRSLRARQVILSNARAIFLNLDGLEESSFPVSHVSAIFVV